MCPNRSTKTKENIDKNISAEQFNEMYENAWRAIRSSGLSFRVLQPSLIRMGADNLNLPMNGKFYDKVRAIFKPDGKPEPGRNWLGSVCFENDLVAIGFVFRTGNVIEATTRSPDWHWNPPYLPKPEIVAKANDALIFLAEEFEAVKCREIGQVAMAEAVAA